MFYVFVSLSVGALGLEKHYIIIIIIIIIITSVHILI